MKIDKVMTRDVVACHAGDSLADAARSMWENDCGALLVVDSRGEPCGFLTDRDVCMCAFFENRPPRELSVEHAMSRNVRTCRASDPIERALAAMADSQVRRLPVLDDEGRVCGMLSSNDLIRASDREGCPEPDELVRVLARIGAPRARDFACVVGAVDGERIEGAEDGLLTVH